MKSREFIEMAREIWGYGFQSKAAKALAIDRGTVNRYVRGKTRHGKIVTIKTETADKLRELFNERDRRQRAD